MFQLISAKSLRQWCEARGLNWRTHLEGYPLAYEMYLGRRYIAPIKKELHRKIIKIKQIPIWKRIWNWIKEKIWKK